jgi:hypothetical protein
MATLFFDGFDRGTTLKRLDPNYWSSEYSKYPKYSFGAYPRIRNGVSYTRTYEYYSPNNGVLPTFNLYASYDYPAFGSTYGTFAPGFLALSNIPIDDEYNEQPITYLQLSGFPIPSGTKSYLGMRCLGIETKHKDYWGESIPLGRFGYKHPLVAFCSGNTTGLILNIVAVTGDNLQPLVTNNPPNNEGRKITIGLEVEQNGGISGVFDLNVSDVISQYRITPYYCGAYDAANIPTNSEYKSLTIAHTLTSSFHASVISRWTHFEIEIDNSNSSGLLSLKIEGADSLAIDNTPESSRENWNIKIPINKFAYNNIRFFNRTYKSNTISSCGYDFTYTRYASGAYYGGGSVTLYDDITLIDNTGNDPKYFLGSDSKVLTLYPGSPPEGVNQNPLRDDHGNATDGLKQWSVVGTSFHRVALVDNDNDTTHITSYTKNSIDAIRYSNFDKDGGNWRLKYNDGIGGIKIYNSARKGFLDTNFTTVGYTGPSDIYADNVLLLVHADDEPVVDFSSYSSPITLNNASLSSDRKFGTSGILFSGNNSYMVVNSPIDFNTVPFTIESWVKFSGNSGVTILDRQYNTNLSNYPLDGSIDSTTDPGYKIVCTTGYLDIIRYYYCSTFTYSTCIPTFSTSPAIIRLPFPSAVPTGVWNHIALVRNTGASSGWYTAYLNGNSGTGYFRLNMPKMNTSCVATSVPYSCTETVTDTVISGGPLFYKKNGDIGDPIFGFSTDFAAGLARLFYNLSSTYKKNDSYPNMPYIYIGKSGLLDEYRITSGIARYSGNFIPSASPFRAIPEDYFQLGPEIQLDRTTYKMTQFYEMKNPSTNLPWSSGDIMTSGIILGVKKT